MFDYLQKFNKLPKDLRDKVSSPSIMAALSDLETQYRVELAIVVMKVMIKEVLVKDLPAYFVSEFAFLPVTAEHLTRDLKERVFSPVAYYLDLMNEIRALDLDKDLGLIIKEAGLVLASENLTVRFKNILATYLKGIRNKIDTRNTLAKDVKIGGLNLNDQEIDSVLKICDSHKFKNLNKNEAPAERATAPVGRLGEIINKTEKAMASLAAEYNVQDAIKNGAVNNQQKAAEIKPEDKPEVKVETKSENKPEIKSEIKSGIKPAVKLDTGHELSAPEKQLDLPKPEVQAKPETVAPSVKLTAPVVPAKPNAPAALNATPSTTAPAKTVAPVKAPVNPSLKPAAPTGVKAASSTAPISSVAAARPVAPNINRQAPVPAATRPQIHDIRPVPKVMGPVDELRFLDLVNFRRLGKTPAEIAAKILGKIKLLEKEGYDKMVMGVRAWRESPVSRLYLRLGQEAIAQEKPLKEIITDRQKAGKEYLSMEEIEMIVSLNGKLSF